MTLVIDLAPEMEKSLQKAARLRGMETTEFVKCLIEENLPDPQEVALADLMETWMDEDETDDPAELESREAEWQELKANLNAHRAAAGERLLFP